MYRYVLNILVPIGPVLYTAYIFMSRFFVLWAMVLVCGSVLSVPIGTRAEQVIELQDGFLKDSKGILSYVHPTTGRGYLLTQPAAALRALRPLAQTVTAQAWGTIKAATTTSAIPRSQLLLVKGNPNRLWYFSSSQQRFYYFDGTKDSFAILRREARQKPQKTVPPVHQSITIPSTAAIPVPPVSSSAFAYTKKNTDHVIVMDVSKGVQMNVVTGHDSIRPTEECRYPKYCKAEARAEAFSGYLKRSNNTPLVLNGGYFDAYSQPLDEQNYHTVSSDLVINGKMESMYGWDKAWGDGGMIAQKKDGSFAFYYPIRHWVPDAEQIQTAVSNYPLVLLSGTPRTKEQMPVSDPNDYKFWLSVRRSGLGLSADGTKVAYVSTVGTVEDLGRALLNAGAANGFALDAGGSNGLAYQGKAIFTLGRKLASVITFR